VATFFCSGGIYVIFRELGKELVGHLEAAENGLKNTDVTVRQAQTKCIKYHQHQWILFIAKNILAYQRIWKYSDQAFGKEYKKL